MYCLLPLVALIMLCNRGICQDQNDEKKDSIILQKKEFKSPTSFYGLHKDSRETRELNLKIDSVKSNDEKGAKNQEENKAIIDTTRNGNDPKNKVKIVSDEKNILKSTRIKN